MKKEKKSLTVDDRNIREASIFAQMSYQQQLTQVPDQTDKDLKKIYKKVDKVVKKKTREFRKANRSKNLTTFSAYLGTNLILPIFIGGLLGLIIGLGMNAASVLEMFKTASIGNIGPMYTMMIQGLISVGIVRGVIEILKFPWRKLGLGKDDHPNKFINVINGIINFFPNIISQLAPKKAEETVEDYINLLENNPNSKEFMKDPEIKARFYLLYFLSHYTVAKPKVYNYKLLHAIKGAVKYAIVGGILSLLNPLSSVLPIRVEIVALAGALTEFILKRGEDKAEIRDVQQKNADFKLITKKLDEEKKNQLIGGLVSQWFGNDSIPESP